MVQPFKRLPFASLPKTPTRPHTFFDLEACAVELPSKPFGSHRVCYRKHGQGPALLLVHGLMTTGYSFRYVVRELGRHFTVYIPDLVGSGRSDKPDRPYHPRQVAAWLGEFQQALGIHGCHAIGNSLGGYICLQLALDDPGAFKRLINVHSPGVPLFRLHALRTAMSLPLAERVLRSLVQRDVQRWIHRNVHYYDETLKSLEECEEYGAPLRTDAGLHAFARTLRETLNPSEMSVFCARLEERKRRGERFPFPLLLMYAERDPMVPPATGERLRVLLPEARFERILRGSHFAHVDAVERFLPPVLEFLTGST